MVTKVIATLAIVELRFSAFSAGSIGVFCGEKR